MGVSVAVGRTSVAVGGGGSVGGISVAVGSGISVAVGGTSVAVGGGGSVGGSASVAVGGGGSVGGGASVAVGGGSSVGRIATSSGVGVTSTVPCWNVPDRITTTAATMKTTAPMMRNNCRFLGLIDTLLCGSIWRPMLTIE